MVAVTTLILTTILTQNIVICYPNDQDKLSRRYHSTAAVNQDLSQDCHLRLGYIVMGRG